MTEFISERVRLILQCIADAPNGESNQFPSEIADARREAERLGLTEEFTNKPPALRPGEGWFGIGKCRLTEAGRIALADANAALGDGATRFVHQTATFNGEEMPFQAPFRVPLTEPYRMLMGTPCVERPSLWKRLFR